MVLDFGLALESAQLALNVVLNGTREIDAENMAQFDAYPSEVSTFVGRTFEIDVAENFINEGKRAFWTHRCVSNQRWNYA